MIPELESRPDNRIVGLLSRWLARHLDNEALRRGLTAIGTDALEPGQAEAVEELLAELEGAARDGRGDLEMLVRETLETVALGG